MTALTYENIYDFLHETVNDLSFYLEELEDAGSILELGCGTGRIMVPLLKAGRNVSGLDVSRDMLSILEKKLEEEPPNQAHETFEGDMRHFELGKSYAAVIIPFNTFLYMDSFESQSSCLTAIHRHLDDGGKLLIDISNPLFILKDRQEGVLFHDFTKIHPRRQSIINFSTTYYYEENCFYWYQFIEEIAQSGVAKMVRHMKLRALFQTEMEVLAKTHGFEVGNIYGSYDRGKAEKNSPHLIFVLSKKRKRG